MKNKQLVVEWCWENLGEFDLLPAITISKHSVCIKWLFFLYRNFSSNK